MVDQNIDQAEWSTENNGQLLWRDRPGKTHFHILLNENSFMLSHFQIRKDEF